MPYADPEKRRAAARQYTQNYAQRNPEKERERFRRYREANRDKIREYYAANRERILEQQRRHYAANKEKILERNRAYTKRRSLESHDKVLSEQREYRNRNRAKIRAYNLDRKHGPGASVVWATLWDQQDGCCYLCGEELNLEVTAQRGLKTAPCVDHDHRCCPKDKTCALCRRGLACGRCNTLIGLVGDEPAVLRQIADHLESALADVAARLAEKHVQATLDDI